MVTHRYYSVCVLAIGNELLNGQVIDSNSTLIAAKLRQAGFLVTRTVHLPDNKLQITSELQSAVAAHDIVITSGGLGPTSDDLTREAVADAACVQLEFSESAFERLTVLFAKRGRPLNENNKRQVYFPAGAEVIVNEWGTADSFVSYLPDSSVPIISLPGVPFELKELLQQRIVPWLQLRYVGAPQARMKALKCFGISESSLGAQIERLDLPPEIEVAYRPSFPEILLAFTVNRAMPEVEQDALLEKAIATVRIGVGEEYFFSDNVDCSLPDCLAELLLERQIRFAAAESCTGGLLAAELTNVPGISVAFLGSLVTYSNSAKEVVLGVKRGALESFGAVSEQVAIAMAEGAKYRLGADYAVSITGIAGPDGGSEHKPVGSIWIGLSGPDGERAFRFHLAWDRRLNRRYSVWLALELLRRAILGLPLEWERK